MENKTEEFTNELLETNSEINDDKKEIIWPKTLENIILRVKNNIGNKTNMDHFWNSHRKSHPTPKKETKRKKGEKQSWKAKKNCNTNEKDKKDKNAAVFMENFFKKKDENKMDLDPKEKIN